MLVQSLPVFLLMAISVLASPRFARADVHFGPLVGFEAYERRSPEPTDSIRFTLGVNLQADTWPGWPLVELTGLVTSGVDEFASQNSIDERLFRIRLGMIVIPYEFDAVLVGLRFGGQYGLGTADYNLRFPLSTDHQEPRYLSPYVGVIVGVTPLAGFGVQDEFTATYDTHLDCWVYQITFGIPLL